MGREMNYSRIFEIMDFDSDDQNFIIPFNQITRKYGREYIAFCKAAWEANGGCQTVEEFCKMNGGMPIGFFKGKIA